MKCYLLFFCFFVFQSASGEVKHKPITSPLNHGVSGSLVFEPPFSDREKLLGSDIGASLNYAYYFSSWDKFLPKNYRGYLNWGLEGGIKLFRRNKALCSRDNPLPTFAYGGAQMRVIYWDIFQPFMGFGFHHAFCRKNLKTIYYSTTKWKPSFSFGFSISLKLLESAAVYNLDADYGLNDLSLFTRCFQMKKSSELKGRFICQFGLEALF